MSAPTDVTATLRTFRAYAALAFCFAWVPVMYTAFTVDRGFSDAQYFLLWSTYYLSMVLAEVPWGWAADRWGPRPLLVAGPAVLGASFVLLGHAGSIELCLAAMALTGAAHAMISGADSAYLYELLRRRGREVDALHEESRTHLWRLLGVSAADLLGGFVAHHLGTPSAFDLSALVMGGAMLLALRLPTVRVEHAPERPSLLTGLREGVARPGVLWVLSWYVAVFVLLRLGFQLYQPTLLAVGAADLRLHGGLLAALNLVAGLATLVVAPAHRRLGEGRASLGVLVLLGLSFAGLSGLPTLGLLPLFILQQVSFGFLQPVGRTALNRRVPSSHRASLLSLQSLLARLAFAGALFALGGPAAAAGLGRLDAPALRELYVGLAWGCGALLLLMGWARRRTLESGPSP